MDKRQVLRVGLIMLILGITGWFGGKAAETKDIVAFTAIWIAALIGVIIVKARLGPIQKADERSVKRSEEAALFAIRTNLIIGAVGSAYAKLLGFDHAAAILGFTAAVPALIWFIAYWILNWRDTH